MFNRVDQISGRGSTEKGRFHSVLMNAAMRTSGWQFGD